MSLLLLHFLLPLLLLLNIQQIDASVFTDETEQCKREDGYGRKTFVCDIHGRLAGTTRKKLTDMLAGLKDRIGCECADGCVRSDGTDAFIGLLHVTSSKNTDDLKMDMEKEYENAELGNTTCDHGLVMVYLKDTQQLATFRGGDSFVLLGDDDMLKLHKLAAQQGSESDTLAVQYLLSNYKQVSEAPIDNWYAWWLPVFGLIAAVLLVLCIVSILLSILCAKCLCCCRKNKKEKYEVTKPATYKSIEPLYVITPPSTLNPRHTDGIYSTPYSGSPMPFPPPPGTTVPHTPNSTYRYRLDTKGKHPRDMTDTGSMGQLPMDEPRIGHPIYSPLPALDATYGTIPRARLAPNGPPLSPTYSATNDPHFLDPRRRQETQTREELIY